MPKQVFKIDNFSGWISNNPDPRDIQDNEFVQLAGWDISQQGILKIIGHPKSGLPGLPTHGFPNGLNDQLLNSEDANAGYGMSVFSADNNGAASPIEFDGDRLQSQMYNDDYASLATDYVIHSTGTSGITYISKRGTTQWDTSYWQFYPNTNKSDHDWTPKHIFQKHGKILRVIDTKFEEILDKDITLGDDGYPEIGPAWYGWVNHNAIFGYNHFYTNQIGYYATSSFILSAFKRRGTTLQGKAKYTASSGAWTFFVPDTYEIGSETLNSGLFIPALCVLTRYTSEGGWRGKKRYSYSYIYDGNQESQLTKFNVDDEHSDDGEKAFRLYFSAWNFGSITDVANDTPMSNEYMNRFNKRITGINVYFQNLEEVTYGEDRPDGEPIFMFHVDFKRGLKTLDSPVYGPWGTGDTTPFAPAYTGVSGIDQFAHFRNEPPGPTFDAMAGYAHDSESINCIYKTYCVANNRIWAGNIVRYVTKDTGAVWVDEPDAMIKSLPLKHDIFPASNKIEVTIGDGDEIIALEAFGDKLLQFKKNKLHIINIAQDFEFLEGTFEHRGVDSPHAVCLTDVGVFWVNKYGAYLFDGSKLLNLLEKKGVQILNQTAWELFIRPWTTADTEIYNTPSCTYMPHERQILISSTLSDITEDDIGIGDDTDPEIIENDTIAIRPPNNEDDINETSSHRPSKFTGSGHRALLDPFWGKNSPANRHLTEVEKRYTTYRRVGRNGRNMTSMGSFRMRNGVGPMMLFDLKTLSFVFDGDRLGECFDDNGNPNSPVISDITKPIAVWGGLIVWSDRQRYYTWNKTPMHNNCFLKTKDFDFGAPGVRKKIYKVYISFRGNGNGMQVRYVTDGELNIGNYRQFDSTDLTSQDRDSWTVAEFKPQVSSQANNIYSFSLIIHNDDASNVNPSNRDFEINDISIVYRLKNVK